MKAIKDDRAAKLVTDAANLVQYSDAIDTQVDLIATKKAAMEAANKAWEDRDQSADGTTPNNQL